MMNRSVNNFSPATTTMVEPTTKNEYNKSLCLQDIYWYSENETEKVDSHEYSNNNTTTTTDSTRTTNTNSLTQWEGTKVSFLLYIIPHNALKRWITAIIQKLSDVAWDHWDHRNDESSTITTTALNKGLQQSIVASDLPTSRLSWHPLLNHPFFLIQSLVTFLIPHAGFLYTADNTN
jgi:hypothetical protein